MGDSMGMQDNSIKNSHQFQGLDQSGATEHLQHRVPGLDMRSNVSYGAFTVIAGYAGAVRSFSSNVLSFNGQGATPRAVHVESAYHFTLLNRPGSYAVGYDHSWQALALDYYF